MKYYIGIKIKSFQDLTELISKLHLYGLCFGWYFSTVSTVRIFSDNDNDLTLFGSEVKLVPEYSFFIRCERVRSAERQTPRQQEKRMKKLAEHLSEKGIEFNKGTVQSPAKYDYFVNMKSFSSNKNFRLFIKNTISKKGVIGKFSSYGLSLNNSNLPYWS